MKYAICHLSLAPVRAKPSEQSEMTSQLLFGEMMLVEGIHKSWAKIKLSFDDYEGWVDSKQIMEISEECYMKFSQFNPNLVTDIVGILKNVSENFLFPVLLGSSLPYIANNIFYIDRVKYEYNSEVSDSNKKSTAEDVINNAFMYLYSPYLWGGRSPFGIDCSGFTQMAFKLSGISIPRDAWQQAEKGQTVNFIEQAVTGDIAFFENTENKIVHTGILISKDKIIHASGSVRIDKIDHQGIYNEKLQKYTHNLRIIKRLTL